jgi:hypothetical protein
MIDGQLAREYRYRVSLGGTNVYFNLWLLVLLGTKWGSLRVVWMSLPIRLEP